MGFDYLSSLLADSGIAFLNIFGRRQTKLYSCLQSWRDRSLLVSVVKHLYDFASELCKVLNSPNSDCIDKAVGTAVREGETLVPLAAFKIGLQLNRERPTQSLRGDLDQLSPSWDCSGGGATLYCNRIHCIFFSASSASKQQLSQALSKRNGK